MKARYFNGESILDAKIKRQQSYGWSSLLSGIALLKKGSRYIVGDGKNVRIGIDNVVDSHPPRPFITKPECEHLALHSLIETNGYSRRWDALKISEVIDHSDQAIISGIYLARESKLDKLIWNYNTSGEYTVRSGYWFLTHDPSDGINLLNRPHGSVELKNKIWKLPIMPKIKHFLWRLLSKALATTERLTSRGMSIDPICPRCRRENETINHALFTCPSSTMIWRLSNIFSSRTHTMSEDIEENISNFLNLLQHNHMTEVQKLLPFWLLWRIWKSRNNLVFNNYRESVSKIVTQAQAETKEWIESTRKQGRSSQAQPPPTSATGLWIAPTQPYVKCNFDAGFNLQHLQATGGWIIRDYRGFSQSWGALVLDNVGSPLEAEAKALLAALQQSWIRGYTNVIFEGDCEILINLVNGAMGHLSLTNHLLDIRFWTSKFSSSQFRFVKREGNQSAHVLAKFGCVSSPFYSDYVSQPLWFERQVCNDIQHLI